MKKLFDVPDSYKEHIAMFDIIDAFLALGIIVAYFVVLVLFCLILESNLIAYMVQSNPLGFC